MDVIPVQSEGRIGPIDRSERQTLRQRSPLQGRYDQPLDRHSAFEMLKERAEASLARQQAEMAEARQRRDQERAQKKSRGGRQSVGEAMIKSAARAIGSQIGRQIIRGVLGSIFGRR